MTQDATSRTSATTGLADSNGPGAGTGAGSATGRPRRSRIPRAPRPEGRSHRCTPRVLTHPHVVGGIVVCPGCGRVAELGQSRGPREVPSQRVA